MRIEIEIPDCFRARHAAAVRLSGDEMLTAAIGFIQVIRAARHGEDLSHEDRFLLGALTLEVARILNTPKRVPGPALRLVKDSAP